MILEYTSCNHLLWFHIHYDTQHGHGHNTVLDAETGTAYKLLQMENQKVYPLS